MACIHTSLESSLPPKRYDHNDDDDDDKNNEDRNNYSSNDIDTVTFHWRLIYMYSVIGASTS